MAKYYVVKEEKGLGCMNMVVWDCLLIVLFTVVYTPDTIHMVFRILIGLALCLVFFLIMRIKALGTIIQIAAGLFWTYVVMSVFQVEKWKFVAGDAVWTWTMRIIFGVFFVGLHFASSHELHGGNEAPEEFVDGSQEKVYQQKQNESYEGFGKNQDQSSRKEEYKKETGDNRAYEVKLFNGCTDAESLKQRYRSLMKMYHPDVMNGDTHMAQMINNEYERLLGVYSMENS